jgi:glycine cleavage system H protein
MRERSRLARVGVDEFGAALLGTVDRVELPKPGHWVRQGQTAWSFYRNGEKAEMVSPIATAQGSIRQGLADGGSRP